jgi:hypothetical protein
MGGPMSRLREMEYLGGKNGNANALGESGAEWPPAVD